MDVVTVGAGSPLDGATVESVDVTVAAGRSEGGGIEPIPARSRTLVSGDELYLVARPERLRKVAREAAASERE